MKELIKRPASKSAKFSPDVHKHIMKSKGPKTVSEYVGDLIEYKGKIIEILEKPVKLLFKCNTCNDIVQIAGPWEATKTPGIEDMELVIEKTLPHDKYYEYIKEKDKKCEGKLLFYNIPVSPGGKPIKMEQILMYIAKVENINKKIKSKIDNSIVIAEIPVNNDGLINPRVGMLTNPWGNKLIFKTLSIEQFYKNIQIMSGYNRKEIFGDIINTVLNIKFEADICKKVNEETISEMKKIFQEHNIIPEGMFKEVCLNIPSFYWANKCMKTRYGEETKVNGYFLSQNVIELANGKIKWEEALNRFKI